MSPLELMGLAQDRATEAERAITPQNRDVKQQQAHMWAAMAETRARVEASLAEARQHDAARGEREQQQWREAYRQGRESADQRNVYGADRDDLVMHWLLRQRSLRTPGSVTYSLLDQLVHEYGQHADTGLPLTMQTPGEAGMVADPASLAPSSQDGLWGNEGETVAMPDVVMCYCLQGGMGGHQHQPPRCPEEPRSR